MDDLPRDPIPLGAAMGEWTVNKTRVISNVFANTFGFARLPPIFKTIVDAASGPKSPHWEIILAVRTPHIVCLPWVVLILPIGLLSEPRQCSTSYRKFLKYSHLFD